MELDDDVEAVEEAPKLDYDEVIHTSTDEEGANQLLKLKARSDRIKLNNGLEGLADRLSRPITKIRDLEAIINGDIRHLSDSDKDRLDRNLRVAMKVANYTKPITIVDDDVKEVARRVLRDRRSKGKK